MAIHHSYHIIPSTSYTLHHARSMSFRMHYSHLSPLWTVRRRVKLSCCHDSVRNLRISTSRAMRDRGWGVG